MPSLYSIPIATPLSPQLPMPNAVILSMPKLLQFLFILYFFLFLMHLSFFLCPMLLFCIPVPFNFSLPISPYFLSNPAFLFLLNFPNYRNAHRKQEMPLFSILAFLAIVIGVLKKTALQVNSVQLCAIYTQSRTFYNMVNKYWCYYYILFLLPYITITNLIAIISFWIIGQQYLLKYKHQYLLQGKGVKRGCRIHTGSRKWVKFETSPFSPYNYTPGIEKPAESKFEAKRGNSLNPSKNSYLTISPF